jgi:hypothetical protein
MPGENAYDAGLNTWEEMHRLLREIVEVIGIEMSDCFLQL